MNHHPADDCKKATQLLRENNIVSSILKEILNEERPNTIAKSTAKKVIDEDHRTTDEESDTDSIDLSNLTGNLLTILESSIASGNHALQVETLKFLTEYNLTNIEQIKRMVAYYVSLDPEKTSNLLKLLRNAQLPIQGAEMHEFYLLSVIHFIWQGKFMEARQAINPNVHGFGGKTYWKKGMVKNRGSVACSSLLKGYGALLQYDYQYSGNSNDVSELNFLPLVGRLDNAFMSNQPYLHLFAEPYVFFLVQNGQHKDAERFISKFVKKEMMDRIGSNGISPLLAYEIVQHHMPQAPQKLHQEILEAVVKVDPGNPLVLKLCRIYQKRLLKKSFMGKEQLPLSRCLAFVMDFLDQPAPHPPSSYFIEAWSILADVLRLICQKGSDENVKTLLEMWHLERRDWWPSLHFSFHSVQIHEDKSLIDKALVCFLLSGAEDKEEYASFTDNVIRETNSLLLVNLIKNLGPNQQKLSTRFRQFLPDLIREKYPHRLQMSEKPSTSIVSSLSESLSTIEDDDPVVIKLGRYGPNGEFSWDETSETESEESFRELNDEEEFYDADPSKYLSKYITETYKLPLKNALNERFKKRRSIGPINNSSFYLKKRFKKCETEPWSVRLRSSGRTDFIELPDTTKYRDFLGYIRTRETNPSRCSFFTRSANARWQITDNKTVKDHLNESS